MFCPELNNIWVKIARTDAIFSKKTHFYLFCAGDKENKFGNKYHGSFYEKERI
jgi:hypothetical protein